jgi:hypothetical protein
LYNSLVTGGNVDKTGHIRPAIQNLILKFGNNTGILNNISTLFGYGYSTEGEIIAEKTGYLTTHTTKSSVWCPLIWKALNDSGYDIPVHWFDSLELNEMSKYRDFNDNVIALGDIEKWPEYAINILLNNKETYNVTDNDFMSEKIIKDSAVYANNTGTFDTYKMMMTGGGVSLSLGNYIYLIICIIVLVYLLHSCMLLNNVADDMPITTPIVKYPINNMRAV